MDEDSWTQRLPEVSFRVEELEHKYWDGLDLAIHFSRALDESEVATFERVFSAWYTVGAHGGFGRRSSYSKGVMHNVFELENRLDDDAAVVAFRADMGSASFDALAALARCLEGLKLLDVPVAKLVLGRSEEVPRLRIKE
jgi:hypothetical protein